MSRFSPQQRPATHRFYDKMGEDMARSIAGAENWADTRKRQDRADDITERGMQVDEAELTRAQARDYHDYGTVYGSGGPPVGPSTQSGQSTPTEGQTLPNVGGMPTLEGQSTPVEAQQGFAVRGSGYPGDLNSQVDGVPFAGNGEFFFLPKSPAQIKEEERERQMIDEMAATNDPRINQARNPQERRNHAAAVVRNFGIERDPRAEYEMEDEFAQRREGRAETRAQRGGGRDGYDDDVITAAQDSAFNRAVELVQKYGMGYTDAAFRARMEAEEEYGVPVAINVSDLEKYYQLGSEETRTQEAHEREGGGVGMGGRVLGGSPANESPAYEEEEPRVYSSRRDRP